MLRFSYWNGFDVQPYQVYPGQFARGTQSGYNQCNSTTENQQSLCQTAIYNNISGAFPSKSLSYIELSLVSDFCFFAPQKPNSTIADTEGEEVTWCVKKGHGARGIPPGTFSGLQVLNNPNYVQVVGIINQANVNIQPGDFGGELDSGGQDEVRTS
jgi:hypothetical protein